MADYAWAPQPGPQHALVTCPIDEIFYGGARGGGKTDGMLGKFAIKAGNYGQHAVGIFFRRTREDLKEAIERSKEIYRPNGAQWADRHNWWVWPNGARLRFQYLDRDKDADNYQGHSYSDVFFEELTHWPDPAPVNKLRATLRSAVGVPCQFHATGNPGGPGHLWVKARYIDPAPEGMRVISETFEDPFSGEKVTKSRVFIPSKLTDNHYLGADYVANLYQSGNDELVRAWLLGDWDIVEGAFFDTWRQERHVIRPVELPDHWMRFASMDWGSARPFSIGWWAVAGEDWKHPDGTVIPQDAMIRYREWYGVRYTSNGQLEPNVGLKMEIDEVAAGILERQGDDRIQYMVVDPSMYIASGGPSLAEQMLKHGIACRPGDNKRLPGWEQVRGRLNGSEGKPMLYVFSTCTHLIRTLPAQQHDQTRPEELDTDGEDHVVDEARYACMSRPWTVTEPDEEDLFRPQTFDEMRDAITRRRKRRR